MIPKIDIIWLGDAAPLLIYTVGPHRTQKLRHVLKATYANERKKSIDAIFRQSQNSGSFSKLSFLNIQFPSDSLFLSYAFNA
jgi:hypothetical protein